MESTWISDNYENIIQWAKNITKGDELYEELAHYAIETFMTHHRYEEITQKELVQEGHCRGFILAIMRNSWIGKKSKFSRTYKLHRADIGDRKRNVEPEEFEKLLEDQFQIDYDYDHDRIIEAIEGLLEEMDIDTKDLWYKSRLFRMWLENPNYSDLARLTGIPRTSISNAVEEAKQYIRQQLKQRGINYDDI